MRSKHSSAINFNLAATLKENLQKNPSVHISLNHVNKSLNSKFSSPLPHTHEKVFYNTIPGNPPFTSYSCNRCPAITKGA